MKKIDAHVHVGKGFEKALEPEQLLKLMDQNEVEKCVIVPIEQYIAVYNEEGNKYILNLVEKDPDKFIGFASVNPWYLDKSVEVLKRCLDKGLRGLKLNPKLQGFILNSELVYPLIKVTEEYQVPVYFHTGTMVTSEPFQLAELAGDFPKVNFIMGHSGNTDFWTDTSYAAKAYDNIYLETSHNLSGAILGLIQAAGEDRVIFGSNMPRSHQSHEIKKILELNLPKKVQEKIFYNNINRLIGGSSK
jgi:predicted TIM-barrel fold metal-dependent hydrolase